MCVCGRKQLTMTGGGLSFLLINKKKKDLQWSRSSLVSLCAQTEAPSHFSFLPLRTESQGLVGEMDPLQNGTRHQQRALALT